MTTATRATKSTEVWTRRDVSGTVWALSSDGITEYVIDLAAGTCACKGFQHRRTCRHLCAAIARYSQPGPACRPCRICGNPYATGHDYRYVGGGRELDLPICREGDINDHGA